MVKIKGIANDQALFAMSLIAIDRGLRRMGHDRAGSSGLTSQQTDTLQIIAEQGLISFTSLAALLGITISTMSRNVSALVKAGLVLRQRSETRGRETDVRLSDKGKNAAKMVGAERLNAFGAILDELPRAERKQITSSLQALAKRFGTEKAT